MRVLFLLFGLFLSGCPPVHPPLIPPERQADHVRWFRSVFYQEYQREAQTRDGSDRLRRLIKRFPQIARRTHAQNLLAIGLRKQKSLPLRNLEHYFLIMNLLIDDVLPPLPASSPASP